MTLIYQEAGVGQYGRCPREEIVLASNSDNRVLFHKKINYNNERKINFPLVYILHIGKLNFYVIIISGSFSRE